MQLGRGVECLACKGGSRTTNQTPQQPLIGMIFTNADPRYADRLDDKQGGDTIVTMNRVREAITFNAELADESTWLWLNHLAPAITDFISDENRVCCNNDLELTLMLLRGESSKEIQPSGQSSTHHPLVVTNPIDTKGSEFMRKSMRWEAPSMPTSAHDPELLREQATPLVIGKNWFLDQEIPAGGFVRIQDSSQVWEERVDETRIITMEGLTTCLDQNEDGQSLAGDGTF